MKDPAMVVTALTMIAMAANIAALIAILFAVRALLAANRAMAKVSSSLESLEAARASERDSSLSLSHSLAATTTSPCESGSPHLPPESSSRVCDSPMRSKTSYCGGGGFLSVTAVSPNAELTRGHAPQEPK